jgi:hypothetical protein
MGATALFLPAPGLPACTLQARLNFKAAIKTHLIKNK